MPVMRQRGGLWSLQPAFSSFSFLFFRGREGGRQRLASRVGTLTSGQGTFFVHIIRTSLEEAWTD